MDDPRAKCPGCGRPFADPAVTCHPTNATGTSWVCGQAAELEAVNRRGQLAADLLLMAMLGDRVKLAEAAMRAELAKGARAGEKWPGSVPDPDAAPDAENAELSAGAVRFDQGSVTVRVFDEAAWLDWVATNYPARLVTQPASDGRKPLGRAEQGALANALDAASAALSGGGFGATDRAVEQLWESLQEQGFELAERRQTGMVRVVKPDWQAELFKALSKNAREEAGDRAPLDVDPIDGAGLPVAGVKVTVGPPKLVVAPSHDRDIVDAYARQQRGGPLELLPTRPEPVGVAAAVEWAEDQAPELGQVARAAAEARRSGSREG